MRFRAVLKYVEASVFALSNTALSLLYIVVGSRCLLPLNERKGDCIVLGNGPSLRTDLESIRRLTRSIESIFCVNSFALTPEYLDLRPSHYVLLDPGLWYPGFRRWSSIGEPIANAIAERSDWPLTLFLPVEARGGDGCIIRTEQDRPSARPPDPRRCPCAPSRAACVEWPSGWPRRHRRSACER